jgi:3-oxoacyl-[acyl-carrier protein] reductase
MNIAGSVAVVTGAARNIGLTLARSLAAAGARVVLGDVLETELSAAVGSIDAAGGRAAGVVCDVRSDADVARLMDTAIQRFGGLDIVCANAGIVRDGLMLNRNPATGRIDGVLSTADFREVLDVNMTGTFITLREGARRIAERGSPGVLIAVSSIHNTGQPGQINYSSSKAAVALWPKILAGEFHSCGISNLRVVAITPGYTATEGLKRMDPAALSGLLANVHLRRLVEPDELAATIKHVIENDAIDATTIEVTAGATYGPWQRAR